MSCGASLIGCQPCSFSTMCSMCCRRCSLQCASCKLNYRQSGPPSHCLSSDFSDQQGLCSSDVLLSPSAACPAADHKLHRQHCSPLTPHAHCSPMKTCLLASPSLAAPALAQSALTTGVLLSVPSQDRNTVVMDLRQQFTPFWWPPSDWIAPPVIWLYVILHLVDSPEG